MGQREIARRLGLSQAAVSHYVTGRRGGGTRLRPDHHLSRLAEKLAGRIADGLEGPQLTAALCGACTSFRREEGSHPCLCIYEGVSKPEFLERLGRGAGFPKQPCEGMVVQGLLPQIRSRLARALAPSRSQQAVASLLGITQPAVSQYVARERGAGGVSEDPALTDAPIRELADRLQAGLSADERREALCRVCVSSRRALAPSIEA